MCGIVSALAFGQLLKKEERIRQKVMRFMTAELLIETEDRGKDATGAAVLFADGNFVGIKRGEEASKFLASFGKDNKDKYESMLEVWRKYEHPAKIYLGHCRKGTIGEKEDNNNNHPIKVGSIVGVHNGIIRNHEEIQKYLGCKRDGLVDSEIIFRVMNYLTNEGKEPFTMIMMEEIVKRLTGAWSVVAFNSFNTQQIPVFRDGRDLSMLFIRDLGLMFLISDMKFWEKVQYRYERVVGYGDTEMPSLIGMKVDKEEFKDDQAAIFDLSVKCTLETKISDLGEFKKMRRDNKIWTTDSALSSSRVGSYTSYTGTQSMDKSNVKLPDTKPKKADSDNTTRLVFNSITRKYYSEKGNSVIHLGPGESKNIPLEAEATAPVLPTDAGNYINGTTFEKDKPEEVKSSRPLDLTDMTDYSHASSGGAVDKPAVSGIPTVPKALVRLEKIIKADNIIDVKPEDIKVIDMHVDPDLDKTAESVYSSLPNRGYASESSLLDDLDIANIELAKNYGPVFLSNRVARSQWMKGFKAGIQFWKNKTTDDKGTKREKYIADLKTMVVILSNFFSVVKNNRFNHPSAEEVLSNAAEVHLKTRPNFKGDVENVFNEFDSANNAKEVVSIIKTVTNSKGE